MIDDTLTLLIIESNLCLRDKDYTTQALLKYTTTMQKLLQALQPPTVPDFYLDKTVPDGYKIPQKL